MKEATGEANMTIVTVVLIGIISLVAVPIVRGLISSSKDRACCVHNGGAFQGGKCVDSSGNEVSMEGCDEKD